MGVLWTSTEKQNTSSSSESYQVGAGSSARECVGHDLPSNNQVHWTAPLVTPFAAAKAAPSVRVQ